VRFVVHHDLKLSGILHLLVPVGVGHSVHDRPLVVGVEIAGELVTLAGLTVLGGLQGTHSLINALKGVADQPSATGGMRSL
jgi:hypothetical protein